MTRRADRSDASESAILVPSGTGSTRPPVPVQNTNIVQFIAEHLPGEYDAVRVRIVKQENEMDALLAYKAQLERIAADADVDLSPPPKHEGPAHGQ